MDTIQFDDFAKVEIQIGTILVAEPIEGSEKLLRLEVDFGEFKRQILSGIAKFYKPEELIGKQVPFITNLEPRKMMGLESQGMLLAGDSPDGIFLLQPNKEVPAGTKLK